MNPVIYFNFLKWQNNFRIPNFKDTRVIVALLLVSYLVLGLTVLGFNRLPIQVLLIVAFGMALDMLFAGLFRNELIFPISAFISCLSLSLLLSFSLGYYFLWLPVFVTIASKYIFTFKGRHVFNPSLFGICFCLLFGDGFINLAPAYQWIGSAEMAWSMSIFIVTAAILFFVFRIDRMWLILSFLFFYALQICLRGYVMRFHIPFETLVIGTMTSPAFFLFVFFMITDPKTSPASKWGQVLAGFAIAAVDLFYHTKFSLYTFFYAGLTVSLARFLFSHGQRLWQKKWPERPMGYVLKASVISLILMPVLFIYSIGRPQANLFAKLNFSLEPIAASHSGLDAKKSDIFNQVDGRLQHIGKWLLSVGDAIAIADVNNDGLQDIFLTQPLKTKATKAKLYLNQGDFTFKKVAIEPLEPYLDDPKLQGLPSAAVFFDFDNDGDQDLFVGFSYGKSHLFINQISQGKLAFKEKKIAFLEENHGVVIAANAFDFNNDGYLDLLFANAMAPYLIDYPNKVPFSIFDLPKAAYKGDRRMFNFMHHSWHNANNGGPNYILLNEEGRALKAIDNNKLKLKQTRWSLATGIADFNQDGFFDIYIANDFGRDDLFLNQDGLGLQQIQGSRYQDVGLDTYKGMNVSIGDIDGDLKEDVYVSNVHEALQAEGSLLWLNKTKAKSKEIIFKERATQMGALNENRFGWGATMADLNLDGYLDILQANGMVSDKWDKTQETCIDYWYLNEKLARSHPDIHRYADKWADIRGACIFGNEADRVYLNYQGRQFEDVATKVGFHHRANTRAIATADFDNDGDLDVLVTDQFGSPFLYRNNLEQSNYIGLSLEGNGKSCNKNAAGSKVWLSYQLKKTQKKQYREKRLMHGFSAQADSRLLFGLGKLAETASYVEVEIDWCGIGQREKLSLKMNRYHHRLQQGQLAKVN